MYVPVESTVLVTHVTVGTLHTTLTLHTSVESLAESQTVMSVTSQSKCDFLVEGPV